jgi:uncharacterized LabA/DUF88 family protein
MTIDAGIDQQTLTFREQMDGRKVSRLPTGKVVLVDLSSREKIKDGETWLVRLEHRELFAVAYPLDRISAGPLVQVQVPRNATTIVKAVDRPEPAKVVVSIKPEAQLPPAKRALPNMFLKPDDRIAIFVDGANMDGACRDAGYYLDYYKVGAFLRGGAEFRMAFYYIADFTAQDPLQNKFLDFLAHSGYIVRKKQVKVITDKETGAKTYKANVDTEMVLDMVNTADNYDVAFLLSGDSDFERCVDLLRSRGKRVYVMTSEKTVSRELAHVADKPIFFIEDYQDLLVRDERVPKVA